MDTWKATQQLLELRNLAPRLQPASTIEGGDFPLSFAQERMFELSTLAPGANNLAYAYALRGRIDPGRLGAALTVVVDRQAVLRTRFARQAGRLRQTVHASTPIVLEVESLDSPDADQQRARIAAVGMEPFELEREPPFRARLVGLAPVGLAPACHVLTLTFDRIIYDQQSAQVFFRELMAAYAGDRAMPAGPTLQYVDFCVWQREWLARPELIERLLGYWRPQLRDLVPLPLGRADDRRREHGPMQTASATISATLVGQLEATGRGLGQSLFTMLLTGFSLALREQTGVDDIAVCSSYINRSLPGTARLIGDFSNLVILRADLRELRDHADAVRRVGESVAAALAYQDMPLRFVAQDLVRLPRVMIVLHNAPQRELSLPDLEIEPWSQPLGTDSFDLFVVARPIAGELRLSLQFRPAAIAPDTIAALVSATLEQLPRLATTDERGVDERPTSTRPAHATPIERLSDAELARRIHAELVDEGRARDRPAFPADFDVHVEQVLAYLHDLSAELLGVGMRAEQSLHEHDLDSLSVIHFANRIRRDLGAHVPIETMFGDRSLGELAVEVASSIRTGEFDEPRLEPVDRSAPLPLSFDQLQMWRQATAHEVSHLHVTPFELQISGPLDRELLARSLQRLTDRHESLRTAIVGDAEGRPRQVIAAALPITLRFVDLSRLERSAALAEFDALVEREQTLLFELAQPPLWRAVLVEMQPDHHRLVVCMHHLIMDGYSIGVVHRDLSAIGGGQPLEPPAIQYADFAVWQRRTATPERLRERLDDYRRLLTPTPARLGLPTRTARPPGHVFTAKLLTFELDAELVAALHATRRRTGATIFMLGLAAFIDALRGHATSDDVCVGVPINKRFSHLTEPVIGYFSDQSILRVHVGDQPDRRELVARVRAMTQSALAEQDISLANVLHELGMAAPDDLDAIPYDVFFNEIPWAPELPFGAATMVPRFIPRRTIVYDITVLIREVARPGGAVIEGAWRYRDALFEPALMQALLRDFLASLAALAREPG